MNPLPLFIGGFFSLAYMLVARNSIELASFYITSNVLLFMGLASIKPRKAIKFYRFAREYLKAWIKHIFKPTNGKTEATNE